MESIVFKLCTNASCCPEVEITDEFVMISDDAGGKIKLTREEANLFVAKYIQLKEE